MPLTKESYSMIEDVAYLTDGSANSPGASCGPCGGKCYGPPPPCGKPCRASFSIVKNSTIQRESSPGKLEVDLK